MMVKSEYLRPLVTRDVSNSEVQLIEHHQQFPLSFLISYLILSLCRFLFSNFWLDL